MKRRESSIADISAEAVNLQRALSSWQRQQRLSITHCRFRYPVQRVLHNHESVVLRADMVRSMDAPVAKLVKQIRHVLHRRGVAPQDSDDIIQEAFHRLEAYRREKTVENVAGFLVRTAVNLAIDASRRQRRVSFAEEPVEAHVIIDDAPRPDEVYAARKRLNRLNEGFAELDPITRQMIRAQRMDGLSVAAIAAQHGVSVSAAEKRLAKGLAFLVSWMEGW